MNPTNNYVALSFNMLQFRLLLLLLACFVSLLAAQNQIPELSLNKDKPFRLRTFISNSVDGEPARYRYQFDESYSSEQRRSVIKYNTLGQEREDWFKTASVPFAGTLYIDGPKRSPLVVYNTMKNILRCKELDWSIVEELFQIDVIKSLSNSDQLLDQDDTQIHGPSSLLFWLESIRNDMTEVKTGLGIEVRGIPSLMYKHPFKGSKSAQTYSYYAKSQIRSGGKGIPLRITIDYEHGKFVQYDFHMSSDIEVEQTNSQTGSQANYFAKDLLISEFSVPRAAGCSVAGNQSDIASLMKLTTPQDSFSFSARLGTFVDGRDILLRVAYNKRLNLMRIDQELGDLKYNSVLDFKRGRTQLVNANEAATNEMALKLITPEEMMTEDSGKEESVEIESPKIDADVNLMLFGSKAGNWRYLGLAQVRGMRARVFELYQSDWPVWLRQPVTFSRNWNSDDKDSSDVHKAAVGLNLILNTVIYIQDSGQSLGTHVEGSGHLIGLEISLMDADTGKIVRSVPVLITDFAWRVSQLGVWPQMSNVFSLAHRYAADAGGQHVRVSISLNSDSLLIKDEAKQDLSVGHSRDLSLIESLQYDLGIPASMIYDMRSSIDIADMKTSISVSFLMAKRKQPLVRLRFYGKGNAKSGAMQKLKTMSASLTDCFKLTAQKKVNTFFGYSPRFNLCALESISDSSVMVRPNEKLEPRLFDLFQDGPMDVYLVHHDFGVVEPSLVEDLRDATRQARAGEEQHMKRLLVPILSQRIVKVSFIVRKFQIDDIYDKQDKQLPQINSKEAKKLHNFGLVPDSDLIKLHKLKTNHMNSVGKLEPILDFAACRMACLLDNNCETFSYCLRGSQIECALTSVDFGQANLIFQLIDNLQNQTKDEVNDKTITLNVGHDQTIRVKQQASCELRQKSHLELFTRSQKELKANKLDDFVSQSASGGREECARLCFDQTEAVLPKLAILPDQINSNIDKILADQEQESIKSDSVFEHQKDTGRGLCIGFFYLDALNMNSLPAAVANRFQAPPMNQTQGASSGFCVFKKTGKPVQSDGKSESGAEEQSVALEEFMFQFETTYERQPGLKLIETKKTSLELEALRKFSNSEESLSSPDELQSLKVLIDRRENTQSVLMTGAIDLAICARACTLQLVGPWPACRSFDMVVHPSGINSSNTLCYLNSISYADALEAGRQDLISIDKTHLVSQVHYEPIFDTNGLARWRHSSSTRIAQSKSSHSFLTLSISALGLIIGLVLGLLIGKRVSSDINREASLLDEHQPQIQIGPDDSFNLGSIAVQ